MTESLRKKLMGRVKNALKDPMQAVEDVESFYEDHLKQPVEFGKALSSDIQNYVSDWVISREKFHGVRKGFLTTRMGDYQKRIDNLQKQAQELSNFYKEMVEFTEKTDMTPRVEEAYRIIIQDQERRLDENNNQNEELDNLIAADEKMLRDINLKYPDDRTSKVIDTYLGFRKGLRKTRDSVKWIVGTGRKLGDLFEGQEDSESLE